MSISKNGNIERGGKKSNTMLFRLPSLLLLLLLLAAQQAVCSFNSSRSHHRGRVLALLPHPSQRFSRFSHLLSSIEARGYDVVARGADDPGLRLREWDSWLWDKVRLFLTKPRLFLTKPLRATLQLNLYLALCPN